MSTQKERTDRDRWTVWDPERENAHHFDKRTDADNRMDTAKDLDIEAELHPPGELPEGFEPDEPTELCAVCGEPVAIAEARSGPNSKPVHGECFGSGLDEMSVDESDSEGGATTDGGSAEPVPTEDTTPVEAEVIDHGPESEPESDPEEFDLPDRSVGEDPLEWVPGEFTDEIDGSVAINRKGFEVLAHFYDVDVHADLQVAPEDTGHEYARVKAVATTPDGRECEAFGSAHVDRGDEAPLLLEMAGTRARKRALSIATGVGAVAVEELRNEVEQ